MPDSQNENKPCEPSGSTGEVILQSPGEVTVKHADLPVKPTDSKKVHPRRPLPLVPEPEDDQSGGAPSEKP